MDAGSMTRGKKPAVCTLLTGLEDPSLPEIEGIARDLVERDPETVNFDTVSFVVFCCISATHVHGIQQV